MIRRAHLQDIDQLLILSKKFEEEGITTGLVANSRDLLEELIKSHFWVVVDNNIVIGYLYGKACMNDNLSIFTPEDKKYFEIEEIYIDPNDRNKGFGSRLINSSLKDLLNNEGISRVTVSSANKDWIEIYEFYRRHGFKMWTINMYK